MGTEDSANDEWIELYNPTEEDMSLEGWVLKADDGTPETNLIGTIPAKAFYLLERTGDDSVPRVSADLIYTGALKNSGESLKIYDDSGDLVDEINCDSGWFAGNNETKQTMERTSSGTWQDSQNPGGTPKTENSSSEAKPPEVTKLEPPQSTPEAKTYPLGIIFNEVLPSPEGPDDEEEWIEIFNQNDFEVDLSNWKIKDEQGKTTTFTFPQETKIPPKTYFLLKRPQTKITLNNTGDALTLIQPNEEIIDSITYEKALRGQSYARSPSGWSWSTSLTPGKKNIIPLSISKEATKQKDEPTTKELSEKQTAALNKQPSSSYPTSILIALALAVFSAIAILILKRTVK